MMTSGLIGAKGRPQSSPNPTSRAAGTVRCIQGANEQNLSLGGRSVGWVRANLRHALNLSYFAEATVNGRTADRDHVLNAGDDVEFLCRFGFKGADDCPPEVRNARGLIATYPELAQIGDEVKALGLSTDEAVDATLARVGRFMEQKFGPVRDSEVPTLALLVEMLTRIEGKVETLARNEGRHPDHQPLSITQASKVVNLSETYLRRIIARGELPASNVGTAARPLWRIVPADLRRWLETKKGGHPKVPPRSDLKDLIRRHLPDL
jgi:excisionase family DNA binding protein